MNKKIIISIVLIMLMLICLVFNSCNASVAVTKTNLKEALDSYVEENTSSDKPSITMTDDAINIVYYENNYRIDYDIGTDLTFTITSHFTKGMSYEEFEAVNKGMTLLMVPYSAVMKIEGVEFKDSSMYMLASILNTATAGDEKEFATFEDSVEYDGKTFTKAEFSNHIVEYIDYAYETRTSFSDNGADQYSTFTWIIEKKNLTDTSCDIVNTLKINTNANFSKMKGYAEEISNSMDPYRDITESTADLVLKLKVGQTYIIESDKPIGYALSGTDCIETSDSNKKITATKAGVTRGYLSINGTTERRSIYIIVEENTNNEKLDTKTLKLSAEAKTEATPEKKSTASKFSRTGVEENPVLIVAYISVVISILGIFMLIVFSKNKK